MLCLLHWKATATFQCMYVRSVFYNNVLVHGVDKSPEFFLNNRRRHQLNNTMTRRIYTVLQKKTPTHIIGYKLMNS